VEYLEHRMLLTNGLQVVLSINNASLIATLAIADNDIWAFGRSSTLLAEHFNGSNWSVIPTPSVAGGNLGSAAAVAGNDVWAVGDQTNGNGTLIEHWNGTSWSVVSGAKVTNGSFLTGVTAVASNDVWAVGDQPGPNIFSTFIEHWNGTSWSVVSSPQIAGQSILKGVAADSATDVWAVGIANGAGLVEHWNGQTWSVVPSPSIRGNPNNRGTGGLDAVTALSPTNVWAVGTVPGPPPADIGPAIEHWNGTSWAFVTPAIHAGLGVSIATVSADNIWAIIGGGPEQWNGTSWSKIANPSGVNELVAVTALRDGTVVAVGTTNNSAFIVSNVPPGGAAAIAVGPTRFAAPLTVAAATPVAPTPKMPAPLHSAAVDQLFAVDGEANQASPSASRSSKADEAAEIGDAASARESGGLFVLF
jgi:hypothetical protein